MFEENQVVSPRLQGYRAYVDGWMINSNPYSDRAELSERDDDFYEWNEGWHEAENDDMRGELDDDYDYLD